MGKGILLNWFIFLGRFLSNLLIFMDMQGKQFKVKSMVEFKTLRILNGKTVIFYGIEINEKKKNVHVHFLSVFLCYKYNFFAFPKDVFYL